MEFVPLLALGTLVFTLVNFLKYLTVKDWKAVTSQVVAWVAGVVGVFVMAQTQFASGIAMGDETLASLDFWSTLLVGLLATSLLSTGNEFKKAIDNRDSAKTPSWFEPLGDVGGPAELPAPPGNGHRQAAPIATSKT